MKKYTVVQIADMLDTNPETVRRWIRSDKLQAEQASRKQGNVVTEADLVCFLKGAPKYAARYEAQLPKTMEVRIYPQGFENEPAVSKIYPAGAASMTRARTSFVRPMTKAMKMASASVLEGAANIETPKGMEIAKLTARKAQLEKEMAQINRQLKIMGAETSALGIKKK